MAFLGAFTLVVGAVMLFESKRLVSESGDILKEARACLLRSRSLDRQTARNLNRIVEIQAALRTTEDHTEGPVAAPADAEEGGVRGMLAFVDTEVSRTALIRSLREHAKRDAIIRGAYWQNGTGCAVGCSLHDFYPGQESAHGLYPQAFGIPEGLAHLQDRIFEGLSNGSASRWPMRFTRAIRKGADLSGVLPSFLYRVVERRRDVLVHMEALADDLRVEVVEALEQTMDALELWRDQGDTSMLGAAARSAWSAARSARSAWSAAGWSAAYAAYAAGSAASAAGYAASAAGYAASAAASAAESAEYTWMADVLIEELKSAPVKS